MLLSKHKFIIMLALICVSPVLGGDKDTTGGSEKSHRDSLRLENNLSGCSTNSENYNAAVRTLTKQLERRSTLNELQEMINKEQIKSLALKKEAVKIQTLRKSFTPQVSNLSSSRKDDSKQRKLSKSRSSRTKSSANKKKKRLSFKGFTNNFVKGLNRLAKSSAPRDQTVKGDNKSVISKREKTTKAEKDTTVNNDHLLSKILEQTVNQNQTIIRLMKRESTLRAQNTADIKELVRKKTVDIQKTVTAKADTVTAKVTAKAVDVMHMVQQKALDVREVVQEGNSDVRETVRDAAVATRLTVIGEAHETKVFVLHNGKKQTK